MPQFTDDVQLLDATGKAIIVLDGNANTHSASIRAGGTGGYSGGLLISDKDAHLRLGVNSDNGQLNMWRSPGAGEELKPDLTRTLQLSSRPSISLRVNGKSTMRLDGVDANIYLGGNGAAGNLMLLRKESDNDTSAGVAQATIHLNGQTGDIVLQNADCAEEFDVAEVAEPGSTMIVGEDGRLFESREAYDSRVVGIVAGLGDLRPGIVLGRKVSSGLRLAVAMLGRVNCRVDATQAPIAVGDLLTTSLRPGHAMKASDSKLAFGAVLGKALKAQAHGLGVIPVLVALQ